VEWRWGDAGDGGGGGHGHVAETGSGGGEDGVADCGGDADEAGFAGSGGGEIFAIEEEDFDVRRVGEAGDAIALEVGILDAAVGELDGFEERAADVLDDGSH